MGYEWRLPCEKRINDFGIESETTAYDPVMCKEATPGMCTPVPA